MDDRLKDLFLSHAAGQHDKAGISRLDVWVETQSQDGLIDNAKLVQSLGEILKTVDMSVQGRWTTIEYLVGRLGLRSSELANAIELAIPLSRLPQSSTAFDEFSAWYAFEHAGGAITPRHLNGPLKGLRARAATHWLDLALIAYAGNDTGLADALCALASDHLLRPQDIETRYRTIEVALRTATLTDVLNRIVGASNAPTFVAHLKKWANDRHGISLNGNIARPTAENNNLETGVNHAKILELVSGIFVDNRTPVLINNTHFDSVMAYG